MFPLLPSLPQGPRLPAGLNAAKIGPLLNMLLLLWILRIFFFKIINLVSYSLHWTLTMFLILGVT